MSDQLTTLIVDAGDFGLYAAVVGTALIFLIPGRAAYALGARIAICGAVAMGYEVVLTHAG